MTTAIVCTALLGLLCFILGMNVSRGRGSGAAGDYPNDLADPFLKRIRAHANTAEFAPMTVIREFYSRIREFSSNNRDTELRFFPRAK